MAEYKINKNGEGLIPLGETHISDGAFKGKKKLKSIVIPDGVTDIGWNAFSECTNLKSVVIPSSVEYIGSMAFYNCTELTSITIPEKVDKIRPYTFSGCGNLSSIRVAEGNKYYDSRNDCNAIIETESNTLLLGCSRTFIPNTVTKIGVNAFTRCKNLTTVLIPKSVTSIGDYAFADCSSLDTLTCLAMTPPALGENGFYGCDNPTLFVPCEALSDYQAHEQWGQFTTIECIASEEAETEEVVIESGTTTVIITWPTEEGADTYTIVIKKDGEVVCTLTFNSEGQLISIAFAPGRDGNHPAQYAEAVANGGYRFTVTGLEEGTHYTYNIDVKNTANQTINSHTGAFTTQSTTAVDNITTTTANIQKIMRDGQLIILRDGVEYNAMGAEIQ